MTIKPVSVALIGFGYWGKKCMDTIAHIPGLDVNYLVTSQVFPDTQFPTTTLYRHWEQLLTVPGLEGVVIAAPSDVHYEIAKEFIKKQIPVFIEKPMTLSVQQAEELVVLAKKYQSKVVVDHILLFSPAFNAFSDFLTQHVNDIEKIDMFSGKWKPYPEEISVLWEWAPHEIAMIFSLFSSDLDIKNVQSTSRKFKSTYGQSIELEGLVNHIPISCHWSNLRKKPLRRIVVALNSGTLIFDDKCDQKVVFKDFAGKVTPIQFDPLSALDLALTRFKHVISSQIVDFSDVELGCKVVKTISFIETFLDH
ncbi:hypothetical protein DID78_00180 [Candidatus Marinamargulisbacteria bacterium SCGC AG-343-D04]|nr:hypothetical protein DID78_00180 [Candidatus Marinamargulisbacteria bacterium SCGC AG-343-D04]